jgi:hypothetical protein
VELNSSPYAVGAYKALGSFLLSKPYKPEGAVATRMACWLPVRGLETAQADAELQQPLHRSLSCS